jgi:lipid A 3-O-deacylase
MKSFACMLLFFLFVALPPPGFAQAEIEPQWRWLHKIVGGLFLHDRGPTSDRHERGVDPNLEIQFTPPAWRYWRWIGSPSPMIGMTPNFNGDTSVWYGGLTYEFSLSNRITDALTRDLSRYLFISGGVSAALHNGPLHKDPLGCKVKSDCGFGHRVIPRLNIELGTYFKERHGISFFYDHMSHKHVLPGENEGIDHIGFRYHFRFNAPKPWSACRSFHERRRLIPSSPTPIVVRR